MSGTTLTVETPFFSVEPSSWPTQGIERLRVLPASPDQASAARNERIEAAMTRLSRAGLVCSLAEGDRLHILGGAASFSTHGIHGYDQPFAILQDAEGYLVMIAGTRQFEDREAHVAELRLAVEVVLRTYQDREILQPASAR